MTHKNMTGYSGGLVNSTKSIFIEDDDFIFNRNHKLFDDKPLFFESLHKNITNDHHWI